MSAVGFAGGAAGVATGLGTGFAAGSGEKKLPKSSLPVGICSAQLLKVKRSSSFSVSFGFTTSVGSFVTFGDDFFGSGAFSSALRGFFVFVDFADFFDFGSSTSSSETSSSDSSDSGSFSTFFLALDFFVAPVGLPVGGSAPFFYKTFIHIFIFDEALEGISCVIWTRFSTFWEIVLPVSIRFFVSNICNNVCHLLSPSIEGDGSYFRNMNTNTTMNARTLNANKYSQIGRSPSRLLQSTLSTIFVFWQLEQIK